jgi:hypothetical protein
MQIYQQIDAEFAQYEAEAAALQLRMDALTQRRESIRQQAHDQALPEIVERMAHEQLAVIAAMKERIGALDSIVGAALGLDEDDIAEIQRDLEADPFLKGIRPRYPGTVTRKQGFRTGLDSGERYD